MDELNEQATKASNTVPLIALNDAFEVIADALADIQFGFEKVTAEINKNGNVTFTYTTEYGQIFKFEAEK